MEKALKYIKKLKIVELITAVIAVALIFMYISNNFIGRNNSADDLEKRKDIDAQYFALNSFFASNRYYPSAVDFSDANWRKENMPGLSDQSLSKSLEGGDEDYSYVAKDDEEDCVEKDQKCNRFLLSTTFSNDSSYILVSE